MAKKTVEQRVEELEKWQSHCNIITAGIGGIWMAVTTLGGVIYTYWDQIKHFFQGLKQ